MKSPSSNALLLFARYPRLGTVKSRLAPRLNSQQRLTLYRAFLLDTLDRTALLPVQRFLFFADSSRSQAVAFAERHDLGPGLTVRLQEGDSLGDRMWRACRGLLERFSRVVFIGADSPTLPLPYIRLAFERLEEFPFTLGPVDDGGYYLLGLARLERALFVDIDWGTGKVLEQTLSRLPSEDYSLLPPWYDVDTPSDLSRLAQDLSGRFEGFPRRTSEALRALLNTP